LPVSFPGEKRKRELLGPKKRAPPGRRKRAGSVRLREHNLEEFHPQLPREEGTTTQGKLRGGKKRGNKAHLAWRFAKSSRLRSDEKEKKKKKPTSFRPVNGKRRKRTHIFNVRRSEKGKKKERKLKSRPARKKNDTPVPC